MQNLDVISINIWQTIISVCNLILLYIILKKCLYRPVKRVLHKRESAIKKQYEKAEAAEKTAVETRELWEKKMQKAKTDAEKIQCDAKVRGEKIQTQIIKQAKEVAAEILARAEKDAAATYTREQLKLKSEITELAAQMAEVILKREINVNDHTMAIQNALEEMRDHDA